MAQKKSKSGRVGAAGLLEGNRKWFVIVPACILVMGAGWWAYTELTVVPPPSVQTASEQEMANYFGNERGFGSMPVAQREQFLLSTWQHYAQAPPERRERFERAFNRMSPAEQKAFTDATFDVMRVNVMKHADEYGRQGSAASKSKYVDRFIDDFEQLRANLTGGGTAATGANFATPFERQAPRSSEEIHKMIIERTSPKERARAEPFVNKTIERYRQRQAQQARR